MRPTRVLPSTTSRVPVRDSNVERIQEMVVQTVQSSPQNVDQRLAALDREWDIDRMYEITIALICAVGLVLAPAVNLWWLLLPAFGAVSLLTHALFGWSVLLFVFRAFGIRTATEIAYERYALKALRGDFHQVAAITTPEDREAISNFEGEGGNAYGPPVFEASDPGVVKEVLDAVQK